MTIKQKLLNFFYPVLMLEGKRSKIFQNTNHQLPAHSFYALHFTLNGGATIAMNQFAGKKIIIVNTASDCGYTAQYAQLEKLFKQYLDRLCIIAFPSNDFGNQEKENNENIIAFCKMNYGISFPIAQKSKVKNGTDQQEVFSWLSNKEKNGWCSKQPAWNFCKYLIDEKGILFAYVPQNISPLDQKIIDWIEG